MTKKRSKIKDNKISRKRLTLAIIAILVVAVALSGSLFGVFYFTGYSVNPEIPHNITAKNVILLIGDGMGANHIDVAALKNPPIMATLPHSGYVSTRSISLIPTDSAAAATAMATGKKVFNGSINYSAGKEIPHLGEAVKAKDKKLGIIATKSVTDATPAAFSSHVKSRKQQQQIAEQQVRQSDCDFLFGLGKEYFDPLAAEIATAERAYVNTPEDLADCDAEKIYAIFDGNIPTTGDFTLASLTSKALAKLDTNNPNGFFLMVEGSKIDSESHDNDINGMLDQFFAFDKAVQIAMGYAAINKDTLVIVVADHETGALSMPENNDPALINDDLFHSGNHSWRDIRYYASGAGAEYIPDKIDNTDIYNIIYKLMKL